MDKIKSQATVFYAYTVGNSQIKSISTSNISYLDLREVNVLTKKFVNKEFYRPDDTLSYTIIISNIGSNCASNLVINDDLDNLDIDLDSLKINSLKQKEINSKFEIKDNSLIIEIPLLEIHDVLYINYLAKTKDAPQKLSNSAIIYSDEMPPIETNKTDLEQKYAQLHISKRTATDYTYYNTDLSYLINLENKGNVAAVDVEVVDELPITFALNETDAVTINNTPTSSYTIDSKTNILKINIDYIKPNSKYEIKVNGKIIK